MKTLTELNALPDPLEAPEEIRLLSDRSEDNRNTLLLANLREGTRFANAVCRGMIPLDELFSVAAESLLRAIKNYKTQPTHVPLLSYAKSYIRGGVNQAWRSRDVVDYGDDIPEKPLEPWNTSEECVDPDFEGIDNRERMEWVKPHLSKLSELERRTLVLLFESKLTGAQIARMVGCTRANVREIRLRALKKIRAGLYREGRLYEGSRT
jgi:RNA polymerase sigma factor (sigma-70 family)